MAKRRQTTPPRDEVPPPAPTRESDRYRPFATEDDDMPLA